MIFDKDDNELLSDIDGTLGDIDSTLDDVIGTLKDIRDELKIANRLKKTEIELKYNVQVP